jgi:hypothetical protein
MVRVQQRIGTQESGSFLKKKYKKRLSIGTRSVAGGTGQTGKSFLVLFFKKEQLSSGVRF